MKIISVDPGKKGSIVVLDEGRPVCSYDMPLTLVRSKTRVNPRALFALFKRHEMHTTAVILEHVGASPRMGSASAFSFGHSFGIVQGVAAGMGLSCELVTPQTWKVYHGLLKKSKDDSRLKMIALFPELKEQYRLKKSVDKAEAALIGLAWLGNNNDK